MSDTLGLMLWVAAAAGLVLLAVQVVAVFVHLRTPPPLPARYPAISVLKPLCGIDDDLEKNLELFAALDYPRYEVLLGLKSPRDAAYGLARAATARWPDRFRVVLQQGEPGLNPKVNQLITLARAARHEILVVSDSNVQVEQGYLSEIAAHLQRPEVGLVTHAVVGVGAQRLGSLMDNLHLAGSVGPGMIAAKRLAGQDIVVGKSMALRRTDLADMGGFEAVKDVLAEDYVMGRMIWDELGKEVVVAHQPIWNVSRRRGVADFMGRYQRWSVLQRKLVGPLVYMSQALLNPVLLALAALAVSPSKSAVAAFGACCAAKAALDGLSARAFRAECFGLSALVLVPIKDLVFAASWIRGALDGRVEWRGNKLEVLAGTRLRCPVPARMGGGQSLASPGSA